MDHALEKAEISDADELYRRIHPSHIKDGRILSVAFMLHSKPDPQLSVDLVRLTTTAQCLAKYVGKGYRIGAFSAKVPRANGLSVEHDPIPDNVAHALIIGASTKLICRLLAEAAALLSDTV